MNLIVGTNKILAFLLLLIVFSGCNKDKNEPSPNNNTYIPTYYIKYKIDGKLMTFMDDTAKATRGIAGGNQTATLDGLFSKESASARFFINGGIIGIVSGLNVTMDEDSYSYFKYKLSSGPEFSSIYTSVNDSEGINFYVSSCDYKKGGIIQGTFKGVIRTSDKSSFLAITDGEYKLIFNN